VTKPPRALVAEWYGKADALARQRGDRDIETPAGDLRGNGRKIGGRGVGHAEFLAHCEEDGSFELATAKRRFLHSHAWASTQDRAVWELHCDGLSGREIARRLGLDRNVPQRTLPRLLLAFERRDQRKRGRPRDPSSLRSEGLRLEVRLTQRAQLAVDHIRQVLKVKASEVVRVALEEYARRLTVRTGNLSHGDGIS